MIDIHNHILPGMDDGAQALEDSLNIAYQAEKKGVSTIVATPHHNNGEWSNFREDILFKVDELNTYLRNHEINVEILPGQEIRLYEGILQDLERKEIQTINNSSYILLEFPENYIPLFTGRMIYELLLNGYRPVIAHPERNKQIQKNPEILRKLLLQGAFCQITAGSVCGKFGRKAKKCSEKLLKNNLVHLMASDTHDVRTRKSYLTEGYDRVEKKFGMEAKETIEINARLLINDEPLVIEQPLAFV